MDNSFNDISILVVDDEDLVREVIVDYLDGKGFHVSEATSGNKAFHLVEQHKFDLVISDYKMPDGNGYELLENIQRLNEPRPKVILCTGFLEATPETVKEKGGVELFDKPINHKILLATIKNILSL